MVGQYIVGGGHSIPNIFMCQESVHGILDCGQVNHLKTCPQCKLTSQLSAHGSDNFFTTTNLQSRC